MSTSTPQAALGEPQTESLVQQPDKRSACADEGSQADWQDAMSSRDLIRSLSFAAWDAETGAHR